MFNKKLFVLFSLMVMLVFLSGWDLEAGDSHHKDKVKEMKCVVCGHAIAKDAVKHTSDYKGKTYYFANEKCHAEFEKNPGKYAAASEVFYSCPMHPEEKSMKEGKCSKCGMALKKHEHKSYYVCPMSQCKIRSDEPGKCPKCGMDLKKVTVAGDCCKTGKK
jgi:YHS domain-containing protein